MKSHTSPARSAGISRLSYLYHPLEWAICGYSGSGKTTLMLRLIESLSQDMRVAYVKHSAHRIELDRPGKDTDQARLAGASLCLIQTDNHQSLAVMEHDAISGLTDDIRSLHCDIALVEGAKTEAKIAKIVMVDPAQTILRDLPEGAVALCGAEFISHDLPWFARDDISGILTFLKAAWQRRIAERPLKGLILSGGQSQRMGMDKGLLRYGGDQSQVEVLAGLLSSVTPEVYLSARRGQYSEELWPELPRIYDRFADLGPLGALASAQWADPEAAYLVVACDMPGLTSDHIRRLLAARNPYCWASVTHVAERWEPCCAIYEPKFFRIAMQAIGLRELSLSRILQHLRVASVEQELGPNVNSPEQRQSFLRNQPS